MCKSHWIGSDDIKQSTLWPECVVKRAQTDDANDNSEIMLLAHAIGGVGFTDMTTEDIEELLKEPVLADEDLLEMIGVGETDEEQPDSEMALNIAEQLANHFINNDPHIERAVTFRNDLKYCVARYKEVLKSYQT